MGFATQSLGENAGGVSPRKRSVVRRRAEIIFEVVDELIELSLTRNRCGEHEVSSALGKHRAKSLTRLADPFDQDDELTRDPNFSLDERLRRRILTGRIRLAHVFTGCPQAPGASRPGRPCTR